MANVQGMMSYGYFADAEFDRETAQLCLDAAKRYLRNADVREPVEEDPLYDLGVYMLAMHWYDHRGVAEVGSVSGEIQHGIQAIIHQLKD